MNKSLRTLLIFLAVIGGVVVLCLLLNLGKVEDFHDKYAGADLTAEVKGMERTGTYSGYLNEYANISDGKEAIDIDLFNYTAEGLGEVSVYNNYEGADKALYTDIQTETTWTVNVPEAGLYNIELDYFLPNSHGVEAERSVAINGEIPFEDAKNITLSRVWKDGGAVRVDNQGNQIRPTQVEEFCWQTTRLCDDRGYTADPYKFYFEAGTSTITFGGENEPVIIKALRLAPAEKTLTYAEYSSKHSSATAAGDFILQIEGEDSTHRSESSLYAKYDRSSPTTNPNSVTTTVLNYIGGDTWNSNGQWIEWNFEVPQDGLYNIMIKGRQNYARGSVSSRKVMIDGEVPFEELGIVSFPYANDWECKTLADDEGNPYNIFLTAGAHTIRVEGALGKMGIILSELEDSTFRLNQIYRTLLIYTGASPDKYRDYHIENTYPEILEAMQLESQRLYKIVDDMVEFSGQKADQIATAQTVAQQLERFVKKPQKITTEFTTFKDNITALGTASLNMSETKLDIDYITVASANKEIPEEKSNFLTKFWHETRSFFASFFIDYNSVGDVYEDNGDIVKVWILQGRDQGTILKAMIDDTFTPNTGIPINVEVIDGGALLNAVMAGRGPNVVLGVGADQPVNYALRGASEDITQFEGWQDVLSHYSASSYEQYSLDGHIYGVPETQTFNVMFYRKDIMEELGLEIPNTWKELIELLPTIQGNNLSVGIPTAAGSSGAGSAATSTMSAQPDLAMYFSLLFQYGGDMYNKAGTKTTVNTEEGVRAFDDYVKYFNDYGLPIIYDFVSRFRSGEMPIGIGPYSTYNTLQVSAPEIRGLWDFTLIPGTEKVDADGNSYIDRSDFITGSATMMITTESESIKQQAWEFMKWWAQADTQIRFGREIEALLGSSARYATANRDAFSSLSWSADDIEVLNAQWDWTVGIREVPGGYFTGRHIGNAVRKCINEKVDSRESIIDYSILIDEEIVKKRKEFGLPVE